MAHWLKFIVGILATIGLVVVLLFIQSRIPTSASRTCTVFPVMTIPSPSGDMIAEQEQMTCDDTPQVETNVWVFARGNTKEKWHPFSANSAQRIGETNAFEPVSLAIQWSDDSHLVIAYPRGTTFSSAEQSWQGVQVTYAERFANR